MNWPFEDAANTAVFTSSRVLDGKDWVHYVSHDADDGAWQFHPYDGQTTEEDAKVVSLKSMLEIEPRVAELADLPLGWYAWRQDQGSDWQRAPHNVSN